MTNSSFIYTTYIKTTPEKLWNAITNPEFMKQYWSGTYFASDWKVGSPWQMVHSAGNVTDTGEIVEFNPPKRLVLKWRNEFKPELKSEGYSRCAFDIEVENDAAKLTITHTMDHAGSKFIEAVSGGWPRIVSSLKSYLETGKAMDVQCANSKELENAHKKAAS